MALSRLVCLRGLEAGGDDPDLHNTLGLTLLAENRVPQALDHFRKALELEPDLIQTRFNLAKIALDFGEYGVARDQFLQILNDHPSSRLAAIGLRFTRQLAGAS
jgi:Flp pilus assembly protein TadD